MSEKKANGNSHPGHHDGSSTRAFTVEQKAAVIRVKRCKATDFYDILGLESVRKTCTDGEIKKAYRKLSLLTHPDKNGYEGADEAFKMVSRAFQVLSDSDKKSKYDKFGGDPESRFGSSSAASGASPFSGFAQQRGPGRGGPMFEEEISPEELFRQFFGGGGMGGPFGGMGGPFGGFGGGPGFAFNVGGGGPGIRIHQFGNQQRRRAPNQQAAPTSPLTALQSLLPLLLLFIFPLLSSIFSSPDPVFPAMRFDSAQPPQTFERVTKSHMKLPYWVNPVEINDYTPKQWKALDRQAESLYINRISSECERESLQRQRLANEAQGFFWTDTEKLDQARRMDMPNCRRLNELGYRLH
nr:putative j domain-containing protein c17a3.05c [Quercus suber]